MEQKKVMMKTLRELMSSSHIEVMRKIQNFYMNLYGCQIDLIHKYHLVNSYGSAGGFSRLVNALARACDERVRVFNAKGASNASVVIYSSQRVR
jgi:hypothetical protein